MADSVGVLARDWWMDGGRGVIDVGETAIPTRWTWPRPPERKCVGLITSSTAEHPKGCYNIMHHGGLYVIRMLHKLFVRHPSTDVASVGRSVRKRLGALPRLLLKCPVDPGDRHHWHSVLLAANKHECSWLATPTTSQVSGSLAWSLVLSELDAGGRSKPFGRKP